jgi:hypothetical protein
MRTYLKLLSLGLMMMIIILAGYFTILGAGLAQAV